MAGMGHNEQTPAEEGARREERVREAGQGQRKRPLLRRIKRWLKGKR